MAHPQTIHHICRIGMILVSCATGPSSWASSSNPNEKAFEIANKQPHLKKIASHLKEEAMQIHDPQLRKDTLEVIQKPLFRLLTTRRGSETEIIQKLKQEDLLKNEVQSIFPSTHAPMYFISAPGSTWQGHHSYPGGLVYHTYTNLSLGLQFAHVYSFIYDVNLQTDWIRAAAIWHDAAKTITLPWNEDGSCAQSETTIAGTSAHHIFGVAEVLLRQYPTDFIVILASAHSPPMTGQPLSTLVNYLKAAAILAGVPYTKAGLTENGKALTHALPPLEAYVNHLDDHDYVLTQGTLTAVDHSLQKTLPLQKAQNYWKRNEILSAQGDLRLYQQLRQQPALPPPLSTP